jgi:hypothetical protein
MIAIGAMIEFDTDDPVEAYKLFSELIQMSPHAFESTDEWYDAEGKDMDDIAIEDARQSYFDTLSLPEVQTDA